MEGLPHVIRIAVPTLAAVCVLAACSEPAPPQKTAQQKPPETLSPTPAPPTTPDVTAPASAPVALGAAPTLVAPQSPAAQAINDVQFGAEASTAAATPVAKPAARGPAKSAAKAGPDPVLVKVQVLLDRARFAPGVIDGRGGDNVRQAIAAYERSQGLPEDGKLDDQVWTALTGADAGPVVVDYTLTAEDVAGPFLGTVPQGYEAQSKLAALDYADVAEALGEKFHMDPKLIRSLNPGVDLSVAGGVILVAAPRSGDLPEVAAIEVDKGPEGGAGL